MGLRTLDMLLVSAVLGWPGTHLPKYSKLPSNLGLQKWWIKVFPLSGGPWEIRKLSSLPLSGSQYAQSGFKYLLVTYPKVHQFCYDTPQE